MKNNFPSKILHSAELIVVPFFISAIICMPFLFFGIEDSIYGFTLFIIYGITIVLYAWIRNKRKWPFDFSFRLPSIRWIAYSLLFIVTMILAISHPLNYLINLLLQNKNKGMAMELFSIFSFGAVFIGPIVEELIFRGIILNGLRDKYGSNLALTISSILFAIIHIQPAQIITALLMGLVFGYIFIKTNSLGLVILLHSVANLTSILIGEFLKIDTSIDNLESYMIYGKWTFFIIGISVLICVYLFLKYWRRSGELEFSRK
ncbi:CAAX amino terminal protease family [Belliella baltica DSM 15883]|uniref:CAAX amino terminal protease family n=1 Tax=Belliella baltica (strain DSM 15883 / CIP 108006 / LMG 21964 / BA134) TaxID=866536 RepID=I3Z6B8_BELBD|nr:type II CAAX endopeptidase family protein [Belliella baltica]AFL84786.1 CAAX amino terminal protease family [Belliella baltica DSM 15883]